MNTKLDREPLNSALVNCATSAKYQKNALFYFHILSQMNIVLEPNLPAPAGVNFTHTHFNLYINPKKFGEYSLDDRIFILVHECMHILMGHLGTDGRLTGKNVDSVRNKIKRKLENNPKLQNEVSKMSFKNVTELYNYVRTK